MAGWLIVAVFGLVALLRLVAWDSLQPLVVLDALVLVATIAIRTDIFGERAVVLAPTRG